MSLNLKDPQKIEKALDRAIYFYKEALNLADIPSEWASAQKNLALAFSRMAKI